MEIDKKLFIISGIITVALFMMIYSLNIFLSNGREDFLSERMDDVIENYEEMQTLTLMSDVFGNEATCAAMKEMMSQMDKNLWDLGTKIDKYRRLTEEYMEDPFYLKQKKKFNRRETLYYTLLKETKAWCDINPITILFFYKKAEECSTCDAMSFVLTDLKKDVESELAVFSFDADLDLPSIKVLIDYYNITSYPCTVIEEKVQCGLHDKDELVKLLCSEKNFSMC